VIYVEEAFINFAKFAETSFPVAVSAYLLIRTEARLAELAAAITELRHSLDPKD